MSRIFRSFSASKLGVKRILSSTRYFSSKNPVNWTGIWDETFQPKWDPGTPTTMAQNYLHKLITFDNLPQISNDNDYKTFKILIPLCGLSHDIIYVSKHINYHTKKP